MSPTASQDCINHEGRLSAVEALTRTSAEDRRDLWGSINELRDGLGAIRTNSEVTLQIIRTMADEQTALKHDVRMLTEAKALADGERRRDATVVGVFSAAASGIVTYFVSHWMSTGK